MREKKWRRFMKRVVEYETEELERVLEENPELQNVKAPDDMYDRIMKEVRAQEEKEAEEARTREEQELIRLGTLYKRRKKLDKYIVLAAALVAMLAFGITSVGGPKRIFEEVKWFLAGGEQSNIDTDDERVNVSQATTEEEAYAEIEKTFGFFPVRLYYMPERMIFTEAVIEEETQTAKLYYEKSDEKVMICTIWPNYRTASIGTDIEDKLVNVTKREKDGATITIKEYFIEENKTTRWRAEFEYQNVQYFLMMSGFTRQEMEKTVENLHFYKKN